MLIGIREPDGVGGVNLAIVKVAVRSGSHHDPVAGRGCGDPATRAAPGHDQRVVRESTFKDFIPADGSAPAFIKHARGSTDHVALQLLVVAQSFCDQPSVALVALLPAVFGTLVAADVDDLRRKEFADFVKDRVEKLEQAVVAPAENILTDAPLVSDLYLFTATGELRVSRDRRPSMTGQLDFRHNENPQRSSVRDHFPDLILGVMTAVERAVGFGSVRADVGQSRV